MTYEELNAVNQSINTTDIKGKAYAEVNERVKGFRRLFPNGSISTQLMSIDESDNGKVCVFMATVADENGKTLATGTAYEKENSTYINKTSYIENCETSAVGRALGFLGIGIDTSIASSEEVQNAIANQSATPKSAQKEQETAKAQKKQDEADAHKYAACLANISDQTADEWLAKAKEKYKTPNAIAKCLLRWFVAKSKEAEKAGSNG